LPHFRDAAIDLLWHHMPVVFPFSLFRVDPVVWLNE
jgi:hypothetical protein